MAQQDDRPSRRTVMAAAAGATLVTTGVITGGLTGGAAAGTAPAAAALPPRRAGQGRVVVVRPRASLRDWRPLTPSRWRIGRGQVVLATAGTPPPGPRRPFEHAVVGVGPELDSLRLRAEVRLDEPVSVDNRDVVVIWNYRSPTRFYYAHLCQDNTIYAHNGIFVVDDADRRRIDDQWDGDRGAPPAVTDAEWHRVRLDYDAARGRVEVRLDGARRPLMTATDTTFRGGRVGFGSFDNVGRTRRLHVVGRRAAPRP